MHVLFRIQSATEGSEEGMEGRGWGVEAREDRETRRGRERNLRSQRNL